MAGCSHHTMQGAAGGDRSAVKGDGDGARLGSALEVALTAQLPSSPSPPWPGASEPPPLHRPRCSKGARSGDRPPPSLQRAYGMSMGARGWWCPTAKPGQRPQER